MQVHEVRHGHFRVEGERELTGQKLAQRDAERPEVGRRVHVASRRLGGDVRRRADCLRVRLRDDGDGGAEVGKLAAAIWVEQHVRRLQVAVHDAFCVEEGESAQDVLHVVAARRGGEQPELLNHRVERAASDVLHDDQQVAPGHRTGEVCDDVPVLQRGQHAHLLQEVVGTLPVDLRRHLDVLHRAQRAVLPEHCVHVCVAPAREHVVRPPPVRPGKVGERERHVAGCAGGRLAQLEAGRAADHLPQPCLGGAVAQARAQHRREVLGRTAGAAARLFAARHDRAADGGARDPLGEDAQVRHGFARVGALELRTRQFCEAAHLKVVRVLRLELRELRRRLRRVSQLEVREGVGVVAHRRQPVALVSQQLVHNLRRLCAAFVVGGRPALQQVDRPKPHPGVRLVVHHFRAQHAYAQRAREAFEPVDLPQRRAGDKRGAPPLVADGAGGRLPRGDDARAPVRVAGVRHAPPVGDAEPCNARALAVPDAADEAVEGAENRVAPQLQHSAALEANRVHHSADELLALRERCAREHRADVKRGGKDGALGGAHTELGHALEVDGGRHQRRRRGARRLALPDGRRVRVGVGYAHLPALCERVARRNRRQVAGSATLLREDEGKRGSPLRLGAARHSAAAQRGGDARRADRRRLRRQNVYGRHNGHAEGGPGRGGDLVGSTHLVLFLLLEPSGSAAHRHCKAIWEVSCEGRDSSRQSCGGSRIDRGRRRCCIFLCVRVCA
eukprot:Rhum_TRINITY_DN5269_c0_g1::Rhum_TRINITY_DN5269_c0_g1_i1::g.16987::m.16987